MNMNVMPYALAKTAYLITSSTIQVCIIINCTSLLETRLAIHVSTRRCVASLKH